MALLCRRRIRLTLAALFMCNCSASQHRAHCQHKAIRIFPNEANCLRLIRALASEPDEEWLNGACYLNMPPLREQRKVQLALAA